MISPPPVALSVAGSDCSAGAGIQADLKTFQHFKVHGLTAITCAVAETEKTVEEIHVLPVSFVTQQVSLMLSSFPVTAAKTGMLYSAEHIHAVAQCFKKHPNTQLVVDPVMIASTGTPLIAEEAIHAYRTALLPISKLFTPNLPEAEALSGRSISNETEMTQVAHFLSNQFNTAVLLKGGHLKGNECIDLLVENGICHRLVSSRIQCPNSHGTGCTLSAAIAAALTRHDDLLTAVQVAKTFLEETLRKSYQYPIHPSIHCLNQGTISFDPPMHLG